MTVEANMGKFTINGEDVFLYGGEFHYFRVPKGEWENRLDKLIEAGCNLVSTYVPWVWHEIEEGKYDLTGETNAERDLKSFLELVKKKGLYSIVRPGPYVMAEVRYEGVPNWLLDKYPEVIAKQRDGQEHPTRVVSYLHPIFLKKTEKWYQAVNQIIAPMTIENGGSVIMYQLCNEIGMLHWVTNTSDFNSDTLERFRVYLENNYISLEELNNKYKTQESSFKNFVESFKKNTLDNIPSFHFEWRGFFREYIKEYVDYLRKLALRTGINVPFIVNIHGFKDFSIYSRGVDYPIGLSQLYKTADFEDAILAGDFYPGHIGYDSYHDLVLSSEYTKAISRKEQPLFSAEFQSGRLADRPKLYPQDLDLNTRTCVAHGMNALNYYMFIAGENYENIGLFGRRHEWQAPIDSSGNERPSYEIAKHLGQLFNAIGKRLLDAEKKNHTYIGFNPNDYMTEVIEEKDKLIIDEIVSKRELFASDGILRLLTAANIHYKAVDLLKEIPIKEVSTLWVFSSQYMDSELQNKLVSYVQDGGKLVLYPEIPTKDLLGQSCTILVDQLQLGQWELISRVDIVDVLDVDSVMVRQRLKFTSFVGEPIATFTRTGEKEVAAYKKSIGKGEIVILGLGMGQDYTYQLDVIEKIANLIGIRKHLSSNNQELSLVERRNSKDSFIFVTNYDEINQKGFIYEDGEPLFDFEEIQLPPRSGAIFIRNYQLTSELAIEYATVEITSIKQLDNGFELKAKPIGDKGSIKFKSNSNWNINLDIKPQNGIIKLNNIDSPRTIILTKN